jgi:hypothetical protein
MELGGSDAFIVCEDADIPKALRLESGDASTTQVRSAWPQNASFWSGRSPTNSSGRSLKPPGLYASAILSILHRIWARWHVPTFVTRCTNCCSLGGLGLTFLRTERLTVVNEVTSCHH